MIEIYRKSFRFARESWLWLLVLALVLSAADRFLEGKHGSGGRFVAFMFVLYYFHRCFLFGEKMTGFKAATPAPGVPRFSAGRFILVSLAVIVLPSTIAGVMAIILAAQQFSKDATVGFAILILLPLYWLSLSLFGTAMPAAVDRDPRYKLRAGLRKTFAMMWRLLLGPGLCNLVLYSAIIALAWAEGRMATPLPPVAAFVQSVLVNLIGVFPAIVGVATLCHVYRMIVPTPVPTPAPTPMPQAA